ncbi:MAG TPA: transcriptional regulator [Myxococcales bacterium]|jgi:DMSO reductase anchor subunit|nr:transcriptional regulator [Myxococcales bacterium]
MDTKLLLLLAPIALLELAMKGVALFNLRKQERTRGPKLLWALLILFTTAVGWICYFALGRTDEA